MRESRQRAFEREVASWAEDMQFLESKSITPFVSEDGRVATVAFDEHDFPDGPGPFLEANLHVARLIEMLQEEARTDEGRKVLVAAYKLYQGLQDLEEEHMHD